MGRLSRKPLAPSAPGLGEVEAMMSNETGEGMMDANAVSGEGMDVSASIKSRYGRSQQPEHQHLCAVVTAMAEVLREQGLEPSATAYFGACMASLQRQTGNAAVTTALCTFLSIVLPKIPLPVLRSKGDATLNLLQGLLSSESVNQGTVKAGLLSIDRVVQGMDKATWMGYGPCFNVLLRFCLDRHPKVRKRAQECISSVLMWMHGSPALPVASEVIVNLFEKSVGGVSGDLAAGVSENTEADAGHSRALQVLHILGALKYVLPHLSKKSIGKILPGLGGLYELRHPLLTRHVLATLQALCMNPTADIVAPTLWDILQKVSTQLSAERTRDVDELTVGARVLQQGLERLHNVDPALCAAKLPTVFHSLTGLLASEKEEVVYTAAEGLRTLVQMCLDERMIQQTMVQHQLLSQANRTPTPLERICATAETMLGYQYSSAWDMALQVISDLFEKLGRSSALLMSGSIKGLAELQDLPDPDISCRKQLHKTLGAAVAAMGPDNLLELLPLNMDVSDLSQSRTWLLPILKQHIVGSSLQFFAENMVPLAAHLNDRAVKHSAEGKPVASRNAESLSHSIWALLPSFCNYPVDTAKSFRLVAKSLGDILTNEAELRGIICFSLQKLVLQNRQARGDNLDNIPGKKILEDENEELSASEVKARSLYTAETAALNIAAVAGYARNFLPLLFNLFIQSPSEKRGDLQSTISVIASIASQPTIKEFFLSVMRKLLQATTEACSQDGQSSASVEDSPLSRKCVFMDLALSLTQGLDQEAVLLLFATAKPALQESDPRVQKKAYKLLGRVLKEHNWILAQRLDEILESTVEAMVSCHSSAKRHRLKCLQCIIIHLSKVGGEKMNEAVATLLSEVILATKESNTKTRNASYDLLIGIGHGMENSENGGSAGKLLEFYNMIVGCLAAKSPHMISAAVAGLARLLYEFSSELCPTVPNLLPSVLLLLRSQSREIVKSVLGLVKVIIVRLPGDELQNHLRGIVEGLLLWSDDSKNHFKAKVRTIMERLVRRCGLQSVSNVMPQEHMKLLTHIRKTNEQTQKKKAAAAGADDTKSLRSVASRASTARQSQWRHSEIFSEDSDDSDFEDRTAGTNGARTLGTARSLRTSKSGTMSKLKKQLPEDADLSMGDPLDLMDTRRTREALSNRKLAKKEEDSDDELELDPDGRLIVVEKDDWKNKKRKSELPEEDEDARSQSKAGHKKLRKGPDGKPIKDRAGSRKFHPKPEAGRAYTGQDYASKKGKATGDVQKQGKVEPYAYWPLDPKMLNRREGKKAAARKGMDSVFKATQKLQGMSVNKALGEKVAQKKGSNSKPKKYKQKQKK